MAIGELVTVSGTVSEYPNSTDPGVDSLTEIGGSVSVTISSAKHAAVKPVTGISWADTYAHRENLESMLYRTTEKFVVADNYPLLHYGELGLAAGGELPVQPTDAGPYGSRKAAAGRPGRTRSTRSRWTTAPTHRSSPPKPVPAAVRCPT